MRRDLKVVVVVALFNVVIRLQRTARVLRLGWHIGTEGACPPENTYHRYGTYLGDQLGPAPDTWRKEKKKPQTGTALLLPFVT